MCALQEVESYVSRNRRNEEPREEDEDSEDTRSCASKIPRGGDARERDSLDDFGSYVGEEDDNDTEDFLTSLLEDDDATNKGPAVSDGLGKHVAARFGGPP